MLLHDLEVIYILHYAYRDLFLYIYFLLNVFVYMFILTRIYFMTVFLDTLIDSLLHK